ncbi:MAG: glycosyltransferase family 4 protein [Synechococcaceae cyanobacterium]|nr:glycosyltransferase family 4 protein [Synechococcaceae cyanobacterium]
MTAACLYYHPDAYCTEGRQIMGRHAAGASFLRGFLEGTHGEDLWIQVEERSHLAGFELTARALGRQQPVQVVERSTLGRLEGPGVVFHPGPGLGQEAWQRSFHGHRRWSLCGITHTTCTAAVMDAICAFATAPVQPWDALICTSEAVRAQVQRLLENQAAYLRDRLGATRLVLPQLPLIPLGLHSDDFAPDSGRRERARRQLGLSADTLVVLFSGRLSFHAKAHPLALYQALELAARDCGHPVLLLECGWHANATIREAYREAAAQAAPSVPVRWLDGLDAEARRMAWAAADLFCSPVDNIQESFGITPIEAMAAGLPVVVSDWDGYRDTVRDGIDGFRIPTRMPPGGLGGDLAARHALGIDSYDRYCGSSCAFVAVDVEAIAAAFARLFASGELRRRLGEAGLRRAREQYDWRVILPRYRELWRELQRIRRSSADPPPSAAVWPARPDPFALFAGYASAPLLPATVLWLNAPDAAAAVRRLEVLSSLAMVRYTLPLLPAREELTAVLVAASAGPQPAGQLLLAVGEERRPLMFRALLWLIKLDLLRPAVEAG